MQFAERIFGKKKYDPKLLVLNSSKLLGAKLPQEGPCDEKTGEQLFGYGLSALKEDAVRAPSDALKPLPLLPYRKTPLPAAPNGAGDAGPAPATPQLLPFGKPEPTPRAITTANSQRSPRQPSRPSGSRRAHSVHCAAAIRRPVVARKLYNGKSDLPKHLLFRAMNVHANNA